MANIVDVSNLYFRYNKSEERWTLDNVSLQIKEGEWLAIIGSNGSGKSTFAKLIDGLLEAESGRITVGGLILTEESVWDIRRKIGIVFQNPENQFVGATVADDVAFGLENAGIPQEEMIERVAWALEAVGLSAYKKTAPTDLSGGQKQRVAIAGVIALSPQIIILDEATSMLDPLGRQDILDLVRKVKEKLNLTVLSITHDIDEAALADRIAVFQEGRIRKVGTAAEIFSYGQDLVEMGLDVPYGEQLRLALKDRQVSVPESYLSSQEMVDWLCRLDLNM